MKCNKMLYNNISVAKFSLELSVIQKIHKSNVQIYKAVFEIQMTKRLYFINRKFQTNKESYFINVVSRHKNRRFGQRSYDYYRPEAAELSLQRMKMDERFA